MVGIIDHLGIRKKYPNQRGERTNKRKKKLCIQRDQDHLIIITDNKHNVVLS